MRVGWSGGVKNSNLLTTGLVRSFHSQVHSESYLINITKGTFTALST